MNRNKTVMIIVLIMIILVSIINIIIKNQPFDVPVDMKSTNYIYNDTKTNRIYLDTVLIVGLRELNINNVKVIVRDISYEDTKILKGYELKGLILNQDNEYLVLNTDKKELNADNEYLILIKNTDREESIEILSHELIHLKQIYDKRLIIKDIIIWDDKIYSPTLPYPDRPWENEAFSQSGNLEKRINEKLYKNFGKTK